jgi:hypothetical protein
VSVGLNGEISSNSYRKMGGVHTTCRHLLFDGIASVIERGVALNADQSSRNTICSRWRSQRSNAAARLASKPMPLRERKIYGCNSIPTLTKACRKTAQEVARVVLFGAI